MAERVPMMEDHSVWGIHDAQDPEHGQPSGCGWYRIVQPLNQLRDQGWKVHYQAYTPPPLVENYKIVIGERLDNPEVLGTWRRMSLRHKLVYELDDDVWSVNPVNAAAWNAYSRLATQDAVEEACRISHLVTVSTPHLGEVIKKMTGQQNVVVLPNFIQERLLTMERPRRDKVTIGWAGGASHALDVSMIARPVRNVMEKDDNVELHIIGVDYRPTLGFNHARFTRWEADPADFFKHIDFDIGLAPITDDPFNLSKSYLKALEYAALGIPTIASDFGPYRDFIVDGETGFLVRKPGEWRSRIRELIADPDLREKMGAKAREVAAEHTIEANAWRWASAYEEIL
jgi:glycosyltransferase involved in cell wall biosynthesis